ncbi:hypothetical protein GW813_14655 [bacterium]|nr:hypothetical protein [bacterium]NCQ60246.1 hypothetical protein [Myxococcales bacterium]
MARYTPLVFACLTLGLAPFLPAPHIVGKLRWVLGGGHGMGPMDVFDFLLHGFPWFLLLGLLSYDGVRVVYQRVARRAAPRAD